MPKPKPKPKVKAKVKVTTKNKVQSTAKVPAKPEVLTTEQKFYIEGNMEILSDTEIASNLRLDVSSINDYIKELNMFKRAARASVLMQRPVNGVVAMTEAASMVADDFQRGGNITQSEINLAAAAGNYKLAAQLAEQRQKQVVDNKVKQQAKYNDCWHFIKPKESGK